MDKNNALAVIEQHKNDGALVFINENDLNPQSLFKTMTTKIPAVRTDFHDKPINGEMMPKAHHLQRIAEAAGITFDTKDIIKNETSWTVTVTAIRRGPDGIMYHVDASYDYDWVDREKDGPKKFALQRAETGAQLRAIRKILGLPVTFNQENFLRVVVVCRVVADTDKLLEDPEMRKAAIEIATNGAASIYGPKDVTPEREAIAAPEVTAEPVEDNDDFATFDQAPEDARKALHVQLEDWLLAEPVASSKDASTMIRELIAKEDATVEEMQALIDRCKKYAAKKSGVA